MRPLPYRFGSVIATGVGKTVCFAGLIFLWGIYAVQTDFDSRNGERVTINDDGSARYVSKGLTREK